MSAYRHFLRQPYSASCMRQADPPVPAVGSAWCSGPLAVDSATGGAASGGSTPPDRDVLARGSVRPCTPFPVPLGPAIVGLLLVVGRAEKETRDGVPVPPDGAWPAAGDFSIPVVAVGPAGAAAAAGGGCDGVGASLPFTGASASPSGPSGGLGRAAFP